MGWFEGSASGAMSGGASLGPWGALAGGILGGISGAYNKPKLPRELKNLYKFQYGLADQQRRFAQSAPLSDPAEQAGYAQARGQLGQQLSDQRSELNSLYNPLNDRGNFQPALANQQNQQVGSMMNLQAQHLLAALQQRRQALVSASGIAANAAGAIQNGYQQQPQVDLAGAFGDLARVYSSSQALKQQRAQEQQQQLNQSYPSYLQGQMQQNGIGPEETGWGTTNKTNANASVQGFNPAAQVQALPQLQMPNMGGGGYPNPFGGMRQDMGNMGGAAPASGGGWNFNQRRYQLG